MILIDTPMAGKAGPEIDLSIASMDLTNSKILPAKTLTFILGNKASLITIFFIFSFLVAGLSMLVSGRLIVHAQLQIVTILKHQSLFGIIIKFRNSALPLKTSSETLHIKKCHQL
jgi:hypothetical protein